MTLLKLLMSVDTVVVVAVFVKWSSGNPKLENEVSQIVDVGDFAKAVDRCHR